jgi:hypothetical protein
MSLDHVFRDARLSDLEAELEQFAIDARRAPQRILNAHPPDQRAGACRFVADPKMDAISSASSGENRMVRSLKSVIRQLHAE